MTDAELKKMMASAALRTTGDIFVRVAGDVANGLFGDWRKSNKSAEGAIIEPFG